MFRTRFIARMVHGTPLCGPFLIRHRRAAPKLTCCYCAVDCRISLALVEVEHDHRAF